MDPIPTLPFGIHTFVLNVCVSISALYIRSSMPAFSDSCAITYLTNPFMFNFQAISNFLTL